MNKVVCPFGSTRDISQKHEQSGQTAADNQCHQSAEGNFVVDTGVCLSNGNSGRGFDT